MPQRAAAADAAAIVRPLAVVSRCCIERVILISVVAYRQVMFQFDLPSAVLKIV